MRLWGELLVVFGEQVVDFFFVLELFLGHLFGIRLGIRVGPLCRSFGRCCLCIFLFILPNFLSKFVWGASSPLFITMLSFKTSSELSFMYY